MEEKLFLIKEVHKIYNFADSPSVERRVYWLFNGDEKRDLLVKIEIYNNARIYKFFIGKEKSFDHYLIENTRQIAEICSIKPINEEEVIRRILNSKIEDEDSQMNEQLVKEIEEEVFVWIKSVEGLDLSFLKDDLV
jgi:hypothetical protein